MKTNNKTPERQTGLMAYFLTLLGLRTYRVTSGEWTIHVRAFSPDHAKQLAWENAQQDRITWPDDLRRVSAATC